MAEQHLWYYQKTKLLSVVDEGPFTDAQMLQLANEGQLTLQTSIRSATRTKNQWISAQQVPALAVAINQAKLDADAKKRQDADDKRKQKQETAVTKKEQAALANLKAMESKSVTAKPIQGEMLPPHIWGTPMSPGIQSHPQTVVQVNVGKQATNSLGIASLILGILSLIVCWIPFVGFVFAGLGLLLGIAGIVMSATRRGTGVGYGIAGTAICAVGAIGGLIWFMTIAAAVTGVNQAFDEIAKDSKRRTEAKSNPVNSELLSKFIIESASVTFEKQEFSIGPDATFKFKVKNETGKVIKAVAFECEYVTPGRTLPWETGNVRYSIDGGLEPSESAEWSLKPNMFGSFSSLEKKEGAILKAKVTDLIGPDDKSLLEK